METTSREEKAAVFLYILGSDTADSVLTQLPPERSMTMREQLEYLTASPPSPLEVDETLDEFERLMVLAMGSPATGPRLHRPDASEPDVVDEQCVAEQTPPQPRKAPSPTPSFEPTDDAFSDLQRLATSQIAGALADENARTIALVLETLPSKTAADVVRQLPASLQASAFLAMGSTKPPPRWLLERILRTTVEKAAAMEPVASDAGTREQRIAETLRALPRSYRTRIMEQIAENDPDLLGRLDAMLYVFEDLVRIESRSLQRLLTEIDSDTLLTALNGADDAVVDKVYANISKRVRAHLMEEMQLMGPTPDERIQEARSAIARAIGDLDKQGQLVMVD
ncbi:MAG: hypothetical protein EA424_06915 [Planctomycetaceae bacterium]|jgi:flagellar motor switch protein FliG|nr:MAG: hypothetical protein EA424_06915 [Planctomycetaceae bacterium]